MFNCENNFYFGERRKVIFLQEVKKGVKSFFNIILLLCAIHHHTSSFKMYVSNTLDEHEENIRARYVGVCTSHYDLKVTIT